MESESVSPEWSRVKALFDVALEKPAGQRHTFVEGASAGDVELATEVLSLLDAEEGSEAFFQKLGDTVSDPVAVRGGVDPWAGTLVSGYRILERIGQGGMSSVYRARLEEGGDGGFVAMKLFDELISTPESLERFALEQERLRALDHPGIVQLLESGETESGTHWFTMDLIDGKSIDRWADENGIGVDERIALVIAVCEIVKYAHGQRILHRDLKPSNILINAEGVPILLDFGIAKFLDPEGRGLPSRLTERARAYTPLYASPEQAMGMPVSEASDVFSLGVLLYHLLAGKPPTLVEGRAPEEPARVFQDTGHDAVLVAKARATDPESLFDQLSGPIAPILRRACDWDAAKRYGSVQELSVELHRCLDPEFEPRLDAEPGDTPPGVLGRVMGVFRGGD